jgi:hypothetical protein
MRLFFLLAGLRISPHGLKERQERKSGSRRTGAEEQKGRADMAEFARE